MLLKHFLLGSLLALGSVTALPNPEADLHDVEARDNHHRPRCGKEADLDPMGKLKCICKDKGKEFHPEHMKCRCPEDQMEDPRDHHKCVCKDQDKDKDLMTGRRDRRDPHKCVCKDKDKDKDLTTGVSQGHPSARRQVQGSRARALIMTKTDDE
ncbi:hypothetical protein FOPG_11462 [Fusarium oxysporum f. sp. conglutinans race 2 54008]|uniref:Uncharacterized protein n=1 Tax=Fusarium oxysporum f. sp. conglutinans race 2 54008 TaxID=1089457 RepID=X0HA30_FUSOX|nr:hypothetical protein FOPG_11462 [Fusarium oxysporum f. sp. conglutinans race 2 54008]